MADNPRLLWLGLVVLAACGGGSDAQAPAQPALDEENPSPPPAAPAAALARPVPLDSSLIPEPGSQLVREEFSYRGGNRDPFASLLEGRTTGPELSDLDVVGVMYSPRDRTASTVVLWDRVYAKQYTAREGDRVGRARVSSISENGVRFTIDDFGTQRQVTLVIRKREDVP